MRVNRLLDRPIALTGLAFLTLLAGLIGAVAIGAPDAFRQVHAEHVLAPPSLTATAAPEELADAIAGAARAAGANPTPLSGAGLVQRLRLCAPAATQSRFAEALRATGRVEKVIVDRHSPGGCAELSVTARGQLFLFGTDDLGRDMVSRTLCGIGVSLFVGLVAALAATAIGVCYGSLAGFLGGWPDFVLTRIVDIVYALPFLFLIILIAATLGGGVWLTILIMASLEWTDTARIIRGRTIGILQEDFVQAAVALGVPRRRILLRHVLPNTFELAGVQASILVPKLIILETTLSFLGFGVREPMVSAGLLIAQGTANLQGAPWLALFPAILLIVSLLALEAVSDGLRAEAEPVR